MLYIDDETRSNISRYVVNTGDLIVSVVGTIGLTAYIGKTLDEANLTENCNILLRLKATLRRGRISFFVAQWAWKLLGLELLVPFRPSLH